MMARIFQRVGGAARKLFGKATAKIFGKPAPTNVKEARQAEEVARARESRADREAEQARQLARDLSAPSRRAIAQRAGAAAVEQQRQQLVELARRERIAREEAVSERRKADELRRWANNQEELQTRGRGAQLAARAIADRERAFYRSEKARGRGVLPPEDEFLYLGAPFSRFQSSNVATLQYDIRTRSLYVQYLRGKKGKKYPGPWYRSDHISKSEAMDFYSAYSKGVEVWDSIRVRGSPTANKKPTQKVTGPPDDLPLDRESSAAQFGLSRGL